MKTSGIIFATTLVLAACDAPTPSKNYGQLEGMVKLSESRCADEGFAAGSEQFIECVNKKFDPTGVLPPVYFGR